MSHAFRFIQDSAYCVCQISFNNRLIGKRFDAHLSKRYVWDFFAVARAQNHGDIPPVAEMLPGNYVKISITDMTMPELTGEALAKECISVRNDIPIILCTGYSDITSETKAKKIGIREYVMKPILVKNLAEAIREALKSEKWVFKVIYQLDRLKRWSPATPFIIQFSIVSFQFKGNIEK